MSGNFYRGVSKPVFRQASKAIWQFAIVPSGRSYLENVLPHAGKAGGEVDKGKEANTAEEASLDTAATMSALSPNIIDHCRIPRMSSNASRDSPMFKLVKLLPFLHGLPMILPSRGFSSDSCE